jgi:phosphate/phosphite/phosphonate ABC transporter binding protein
MIVLKRILPHLARMPHFVDMFLREARIAARLSHPNVIQIFELGESGDSYYIAMEYLHGSTARELQLLAHRADVPMPHSVAVNIIIPACRGLHAAHELRDLDGKALGLVHRDISPHNLMVTPEGHVKLLDFGVAKATEGIEATYTGTLKGKYAYMSPEQIEHKPLDRRSDIFALSIVLWELLSQRRLFKRDGEMEMMSAITGHQVPAPRSLDPTLPQVFEDIVLKGLSRDREERFATCEEMRLALVRAADETEMPIGEDGVAQFVNEVAGGRLTEQRATLRQATERTLLSMERRRLLHDDSSSSLDEDFDATAVEVPSRLDIELAMAPGGPIRRWIRRHALYVGLAVGLCVALVAWLLQPGPSDDVPVLVRPPVSGDPLPFGIPPYLDPEEMAADLLSFQYYLESEIGRPIPFVITDTYADCAARVRSGELAFAALPPLLYVRTKLAEPDLEILAIKQFDGADGYDGYLMVFDDSPARTLADLEGSSFCFTDPDSTSGAFLPVAFIREHGFDPDTFIGETYWSGSHLNSLRAIIQGRCDVVATYNAAYLSGTEAGIPVGNLRIFAITGHVPQDAIVASPLTPPDLVRQLQRVLLAFDPMEHLGVERAGGEGQRITGFSPARDADFDTLRQAVLREQAAEAPRE